VLSAEKGGSGRNECGVERGAAEKGRNMRRDDWIPRGGHQKKTKTGPQERYVRLKRRRGDFSVIRNEEPGRRAFAEKKKYRLTLGQRTRVAPTEIRSTTKENIKMTKERLSVPRSIGGDIHFQQGGAKKDNLRADLPFFF